MEMTGLKADQKSRILEALDATHYKQGGFTVRYGDENNPAAAITFSSSPEYRFVINLTGNGAFATSECPGIHLNEAETFQRSNFELCVPAIKDWAERIADRQSDSILDEFGGVADRLPSYKK